MEIIISFEGEEEESLKSLEEELISQFAYFLGREPNEDEIDRLHKFIYVSALKNTLGNWLLAISASGGLAACDPDWRNFSQEEIDREGLKDANPIATC